MMIYQITVMFTTLLVNIITNFMWLVEVRDVGGVGYPHAPAEEAVSCLEARRLSISQNSLLLPECNEDNSFRDKQCWRGLSEQCWCSSPRGERLNDTACLTPTHEDEVPDVREMSAAEAFLILPCYLVVLVISLSVLLLMATCFGWLVLFATTCIQTILPWRSLFCFVCDLCHMGRSLFVQSVCMVQKFFLRAFAPVRRAAVYCWDLLLLSVSIAEQLFNSVVSVLSECVEPFCIFLEIMGHLICVYFAGCLFIQIHKNPTLIFGMLLLAYHYYTNAHAFRYVTDLFLFYILFAIGVTCIEIWAVFFFVVVFCLPTNPDALKYPFLYWVFSKFEFSTEKLFLLYGLFGARTSYTFLASSKKAKGSLLSFFF
eukprot:TRINITY_DN3007_c0_g1_i1.p1 TRINITY_DN3007_c0_g1~~TRINITY_DN3007_c0_g1_i1.p1  ORF type:complete len:387 (+),score=31.21 TRINITY_DN3007_c0_g1_i1:51-1163(+)